MQIKTRLTLIYTSLIAALLLAFTLTIYFTSYENRKEEYFKLLKQQAITKANLLLDSKISPDVLQLIYKKSPNSFSQEEVAIYDTAFRLLYHDAVDVDRVKETHSMIDSTLAEKEFRFYIGEFQATAFVYDHNGMTYVITAAAKDEYGLEKLKTLRNTLAVVFIVAIIITFGVGYFLATKSLQPVASMVDKIRRITATNLDLRVDEGNRRDEIASLAITFNEMLDSIERSFDAQKQFVSNISHELRTPLTAMLTELQLTLSKERTNEEYKQASAHFVADTQKLIRLTKNLLDFAKANYDKAEIAFREVRLDELILDARNEVLHNKPEYKVDIAFEKEIEDDDFLSVQGNEYLLKTAFINLMENSCKFSENKLATVTISYDPAQTILRFSDTGIGIDASELTHIFTPFYRGNNRTHAAGSGIGLSLTQKIIHLHKGDLSVTSEVGKGTTFSIQLPHL
jgi:signal transduction histidine kinase